MERLSLRYSHYKGRLKFIGYKSDGSKQFLIEENKKTLFILMRSRFSQIF